MNDNQTNLQTLPQKGVTCLSLRRIDKGALVGFCDIKIEAWHLVLKDCKWFKKGPAEWIGMPSTKFTDKNGKDHYSDLVEFSDKYSADRFQAAALKAIQDFEG